jgi:hypothetical protein
MASYVLTCVKIQTNKQFLVNALSVWDKIDHTHRLAQNVFVLGFTHYVNGENENYRKGCIKMLGHKLHFVPSIVTGKG